MTIEKKYLKIYGHVRVGIGGDELSPPVDTGAKVRQIVSAQLYTETVS
jgi:hypothetical protein